MLPWSDLVEARELVEALREEGTPHWVGFSADIVISINL